VSSSSSLSPFFGDGVMSVIGAIFLARGLIALLLATLPPSRLLKPRSQLSA
jgi:hypothetical protein